MTFKTIFGDLGHVTEKMHTLHKHNRYTFLHQDGKLLQKLEKH